MKKQEFIDLLSKKFKKAGIELSKKDIDTVFKTIFEELSNLMKKKVAFLVPGFGTFKSKKRAARMGRNPQTGEKIKIKGKNVPSFTASSTLKGKIK